MVMVANQTGTHFGFLAGRYPGAIGHLYSPGKGKAGPFDYFPYALDNGAFIASEKKTPWDEAEWRRLLLWSAMTGQRPLWALVPDVVADRDRTLERFDQYVGEVRRYGFRPAFAVQDGMTFADVPDSECMLFLGGSTPWKEEAIPLWCARFPGRVHVGRVNRFDRLNRSYQSGAVSVDGTGWYHTDNGQRAELTKFIRETYGKEAHGPQRLQSADAGEAA